MNGDELFVKLFRHLSEDNAEESWLAVIQSCLDSGDDISVTYSLNGWSLLHYASENLFCRVASLLLDNGADVNPQAENGSTPYLVALDASIDAAIQNEESEIDFSIVKVLIKQGADTNMCSADGISRDSILDDYGSKASEEYHRMMNSVS